MPADHAFKCRDLRLVLLKKIRRSGIFIKCPGLKLVNPDPDQVARDVVTFGETVECLASEEFLGNLPLEVDAVGTVPGHGFHPLKARLSWSIPNPQDVHLLGRTPLQVMLNCHHCPRCGNRITSGACGELATRMATSR